MDSYSAMDKRELREEIVRLEEQYAAFKARNHKLNMTRGKPCREQLMLSDGLLDCVRPDEITDSTGFDCRNYGILEGIPEARRLFADLLDLDPEQVIVAGNSSLNLMYDTIARAMLFGMAGSARPWAAEEKITFLCPVPGYDRHFGVTESFGIRMTAVPMTPDGPDMDKVEQLAADDPSVRGMWCVPLYSNPDGITYSEETCRRLAAMQTAAPDFTILWDNSYFVHHLDGNADSIPEMIGLCAAYGHPDRAYEFASTSKVTWAGAGIACVASSRTNIDFVRSKMKYQTIGPDKINQLRHVRFLRDRDGVAAMMDRHAKILKPKFDAVLRILEEELGGSGIAHWNVPRGGYFISLFVGQGTAKEVVRLCKECGVELTPAGATYPYGIDPDDSNIRIAPSFPPVEELKTAIGIFCVSVRLAAARKAFRP